MGQIKLSRSPGACGRNTFCAANDALALPCGRLVEIVAEIRCGATRLVRVETRGRRYRYVGTAELKALVRAGGDGRSIRSSADFGQWVSALSPDELAEPFTFVVDGGGVLRLAPRRSEHVVCAAWRRGTERRRDELP